MTRSMGRMSRALVALAVVNVVARGATIWRQSRRARTPAETRTDFAPAPAKESAAPTEGGDTGDRGRSADRPREIPKSGWRDILLRIKNHIDQDNLMIVASGVAFFLLLGIIPGIAAFVSIYGMLADPAAIQQQLASFGHLLPAEVMSIMEEQMSSIAEKKGAAGLGAIIGIAVALWSAGKASKALIKGLNIAYDEREKRGFIKLNVVALGITLTVVAMGIIAIGLVVAVPAILAVLHLEAFSRTLASVLRWPLLLLVASTMLAMLYRFGPCREDAKWRWVSWGAVLATVLWVIASGAFSFYVSNFGNFNKTYGSLGAAIVMMLWLYISAFLVLLGAELNSEMEHQTRKDSTSGEPQPLGKRGAHVADTVGEVP